MKMLHIKHKLNIGLIFYLLITQSCLAQLANFSLTVTHTNETCTANGSLIFNVTNTTAGAQIVYTVYRLSNLTSPLTNQTGTTFNGLVADDYKVIATQTLGNLSNTQEQNVTITSSVVLLSYQLIGKDEVCGNDGKITVNTTSGSPVNYEIILGPILKPLQTSNIFTGLKAGLYNVRVHDACGEALVQTFTLAYSPSDLSNNIQTFINPIDCNHSTFYLAISSGTGGLISYPLQMQLTLQPPSGNLQIYNQTINDGNYITQNISLSGNQVYSYSVIITDFCGKSATSSGSVINPAATPPDIISIDLKCTTTSLEAQNAQSATITVAPSTFNNQLPYSFSTSASGFLEVNNVPYGVYTVVVVDICGVSHTITRKFDPPNSSINPQIIEGCALNVGTILIAPSVGIQSIVLINAPINYSGNLPLDLTNMINPTNNNSLSMGNLPIGSYTFQTIDTCGNNNNVSVNIDGYQETTDYTVFPHCGSFDLQLNHTSNGPGAIFCLQKLNTITNEWCHPQTGVAYLIGDNLDSSNSLLLQNNVINYNLAFIGKFRIVKSSVVFGSTSTSEICNNTIKEFEFFGAPKINDIYSFNCNNSSLNVFVDAIGIAPLHYEIREKNGVPFYVNNGTVSNFNGLSPGIYKFRVTDSCGNFVNSYHDISVQYPLSLSNSNFCPGQNAYLSVQNFQFLTYRWWEQNHPANYLSNTNVLNFPSFNPATQAGNYHITITFPNGSTCPNFSMNYVVSSNTAPPNAGLDNTNTSFCGSNGTLNLNTLLVAPFDTGGTWQEITSSGSLTNNLWNSTSAPTGIYKFKYTVSGYCNLSDDAMVSVELREVPSAPIITGTNALCESQTLQLYASAAANSIFSWTGPANFSSTDQNPALNNITSQNTGLYKVKVALNGCESLISNYPVVVNKNPQFAINSYCDGNVYKVEATPLSNSFLVNNAIFNWSGPDGYVSHENPIDLTRKPKGIYDLEIILQTTNCSNSQPITIGSNLCDIQKGISANTDGNNDDFDLTALKVIPKFEIYNRYGVLVFNQDGYTKQWHGQDNSGNQLPTGTYYYFFVTESNEAKTGWIYVSKD